MTISGLVYDDDLQKEEVSGTDYLATFVPESDRQLLTEVFISLVNLKESTFNENHILTKDGRKLLVEWHGRPIFNKAGGLDYFFGVGTDITERKRVEEIIESSRQMFEAAFKFGPDPMAVTEPDTGHIIDANDSFEAWSGYSKEELIGHSTVDLDFWVDAEERKHIVNELKAGKSVDKLEVKIRTKSGEIRNTIFSARNMTINGRPYMLSNANDITEKKRAEEERKRLEGQLAQAQKMESLGTLAGGIAHDFNNILSAIIGYSELAQSDLSDPEKVTAEIDQVLRAADRAKDLVNQILTFSRKAETTYSPLELPLLVKESLKMLRSVIPSTIEIRQDITGSGLVMSNPTQIHQLIMNLCVNAAHAMENTGGTLTVSLKREDVDSSTARDLDVVPGHYLKLSISDTGHGIPPDVMSRIFEPYFTTKELGRGTGLGLSVVHGIVKSHGGAVNCISVPGEGTTFDVYLPEIELVKGSAGGREKEHIPTGCERILFVDDETALAGMAEKMLGRLGYQVTAMTSSREALNLFQKNPDGFDLVISDMTMPEMTGLSLARAILEIRHGMPIILCTGYSELMSGKKASEIGISDFVMKPFEARELANIIRKVLDKK